MNNYGAKDFLAPRFEALRARRNELAAVIRPLTEPTVGEPPLDWKATSSVMECLPPFSREALCGKK